MQLSPEEIERRLFAIEDRGYDRDEVRDFLVEIAAMLRPPSPEGSGPPPFAAPLDDDQFTRLGAEVAEVLRAAHDAVGSLHEEADREIAARAEESASRSDDLRRQAEVDAAWTHDRAKRLLITAQEQADAIVADAQEQAASVIETARTRAEDHAEQVNSRTRRHADQILRAEREALRRLHQAQAGVAAAVEMLTGSESRPIVDLTELRPNVRLGSLDVEISDSGEIRDRSADDPVNRMIRSAVDRAATHAQGEARFPDAGSVEPDPTAATEPTVDDDAAGLVTNVGDTTSDASGLVAPPGPAPVTVGPPASRAATSVPAGSAEPGSSPRATF